jgi:cytoskeletal protein CcmA (bactofilin family)
MPAGYKDSKFSPLSGKANDMFDKIKGELLERKREVASSHTVAQPVATPNPPEMISSIGAGMTITGKIVGEGAVKIFGRIEGELRASDVFIGEAAHVEGNIIAQELTISGCVKGTIHAVRVKLHGTAKVEGDIFHRSLSIEENALFEGSSRREENPTETTSNVQVRSSNVLSRAQPQLASIDGRPEVLGYGKP